MKNRRYFGYSILFYITTCLLMSCATTLNTVEDASNENNSGVYQLTSTQADQILLKAMQQHFGPRPLSRVVAPYPGYSATIRFALDHEVITAMMVGEGGAYSFEVQATGTMPFTGSSKAKSVIRTIRMLAATAQMTIQSQQ